MKKGFTLVELLAVIIILAVIALISTPIVLDVVDSSKEQGRLRSVEGLLNAAELYAAEAMLDDSKSLEGNLLDAVEVRVEGQKPESGEIKYDKETGKIGIAVEYDGVCYVKNFEDNEIIDMVKENCTLFKEVEEVCYDEKIEVTSYDINYDNKIYHQLLFEKVLRKIVM